MTEQNAIAGENFSADELLARHQDLKSVREYLEEKIQDIAHRDSIMAAVKKAYYLRRRKRGSMVLLLGCILLIIGFVCTVTMFHSGSSFTTVMYFFTAAGIIGILIGLVDVIGF